jgi:hypothetical protein
MEVDGTLPIMHSSDLTVFLDRGLVAHPFSEGRLPKGVRNAHCEVRQGTEGGAVLYDD